MQANAVLSFHTRGLANCAQRTLQDQHFASLLRKPDTIRATDSICMPISNRADDWLEGHWTLLQTGSHRDCPARSSARGVAQGRVALA